MRFNIAKCKVMHVGRGANKSSHVYTMTDDDGTERPLETTQLERDLGVLVSDDLKLGAQCRSAAAKAKWKFGALKKSFTSRNRQMWEILWKTHIRPHLEHAIQAWSPHLKTDIEVLERVQRAVTKHINGMKGLTYEQRHEKLGWTTLEQRRVRGDLILTYQLLHENAAVSLTTWNWTQPLTAIEGPAGSVRANDLRLSPPIKYNCKQREHFLTSRVAAPLRDLPAGIFSSSSVNAFKSTYDKHFS
jgi:ribonuclease P/MRP protein subunit RPP40